MKLMRNRAVIIACLALPPFSPASAAEIKQLDARAILREAEETRSPPKAQVNVNLSTESGKQRTSYDMVVLRSTGRRALINFEGPAEERGRRLLAIGNNYWATFPDSKKVIPISRREMVGNSAFAVADLFQIDAEEDYDPKIIGEETIDSVLCLKLELLAKSESAPYARIEYFVDKQTQFPVTARFYGLSGKHLKTLLVIEKAQLAGRLRPSVLRMVDEVTKGKTSLWTTKQMAQREIPDRIFSKELLSSD